MAQGGVFRDANWSRIAGFTVLALIGAVAAAVRLRMLFEPSPFFYSTYDDGVHFTVALNLVHGRLPYRDVLFLQPPGIAIVTAPFALLASLIGDAHAFALARLAFALVGALNAVLITVLLRRWGIAAQLSGGLLYALSWPAAYAERTISLEVLGTTFVLLSILLLRLDDRRLRWTVLAGVAAGLAIGFKVWYVVPVVILAVAARRRVLPFLTGCAVAGGAVYLPFFVIAPGAMWRDLVTAQLGRPDQGIPVETRIRSIIGLDSAGPHNPPWQIAGDVGVDVLLGLLIVCIVVAVRTPGARLFVALLTGCAAMLLLSPSYLEHYATLTAGPLALVGGTASGRIAAMLPTRRAVVPMTAVVALLAVGANLSQDLDARSQKMVPRAALEAAAAKIPGCLVTDDPTVLLVINRASRDIDRGCPVQADPSGIGFVLDVPGRSRVLRPDNPAFQREVLHYLQSADAYLLVRGEGLGLTTASQQIVDRDPVLYRTGHFVIRAGGEGAPRLVGER